MKKSLFIIIAIVVAGFLSCAEQPVGSTPMDGNAPGVVTEVGYRAVPGGANIYYNLPEDEDLLYVKAYYTLANGKEVNSLVSIYDDTLQVRGYADIEPRDIKIVTGDRSGNESSPVILTINPLRSPIYDIIDNIVLEPTFGGVRIAWDNPTEAVVAVTVMKSVAGGDWEEVNTYYSNSLQGRQAARGMESVASDFAIYVTDRWDNTTEQRVFESVTPLFEEQMEPGIYKEYKMSGDSNIMYGWALNYALNGVIEAYGWFSENITAGGIWPARFTMEFTGGPVSLSRLRLLQRSGEMWENGNPKVFTVYGTNNPNPDGSNDGWVALKTFTSVKPSGLPSGEYSDEDIYIATNGEDFEFDPSMIEPYKYYRFEFTENWGGDNSFINLIEIFFWGQKNY